MGTICTQYDERGGGERLHNWDGTLADECDRDELGEVACGAAGGVGSARSGTGRNRSMIVTDLVDLGLALVFAIVALAITALRKTD